ncbi:restriction endonuclease subunit S [Vibrio cholerae]|uniref:restriction endonuclease subunit S n=1 Tax=Vibrio cholerae TaxID=666 RepID=UPI00308093D0
MTEQQLPEGWQMVKFGDIAKHISKRVEPSETELEVYVGLEHLDPDSLKIKRHGVPSDVAGQKLLVKKGQIIFGKRRAYQRKVAVADWDCICSAHAMVLEANPKNVLPEFLPFFMQSDVFMNRAVAVSEGSLSPTIKWKVLSQQSFQIPNCRKLIESKLKLVGKVDKAIEAAEKSIQQGNKMIDVLLEQRVWREGGSMALGEKRRQQPLREVAHIEPGYAFKSKDAKSDGTKWLKIANVGLGEVTWDEKSFLPENFIELHSQFSLKKGEIVMAMTRPILSERLKLAVVTECDVPSLLNQRVCRIRSKGNSYANEQLSILLRSKHVVRNISVCILGTDPPNISGREIENIRIPVIGDKERDDVFKDIESLSKSISILKDKVAALVEIRKSIINSMVM